MTSSSPNVARSLNSQDSQVYLVAKNGVDQQAHIIRRRTGEVYVHYLNSDKRLDEWIPESDFRLAEEDRGQNDHAGGRKRKRQRMSSRSTSVSPSRRPSAGPSSQTPDHVGNGSTSVAEDVAMTEEDYDIQQHKQITAQRNFDKVSFGRWQIKTWYFSPYPLTETEVEDLAGASQGVPTASATTQGLRIPGVNRTTARSHGRTSDLFAGGLGRSHVERSILWVCDRCFKYMADGVTAELHGRKCTRDSPPGRKVYQRGAHTIWEVDGAKDKLYCQNLSLFGKLFIDVKTLFFDCDNFLFYLLTDGDSKRDHVLGFFSKEKISYDDYNLACIITLPPYQKKGFGTLMIEFSYELSRRAGKVGTPERPLSDLGLRGYLTYWISTLIRFLRRLLSVVPPEAARITSAGATTPNLRSPLRDSEDGGVLNKPRRKRMKGWNGEMAIAPLGVMDDHLFTSLRTIETIANEDGSATSHVIVRCTLGDIARATNLRVEDAAFALGECGLVKRKSADGEGQSGQAGVVEDEGHGEGCVEGDSKVDLVVISREMVEAVARERGVKKMMMDLMHVLL